MTSKLSGPRVACTDGQRVEALVLGHAAARPAATALLTATGEVSYAELAATSATIAGGLAAAGVRPGGTVAVRLPRGLPMVATMLAVLRCGAAYSGIPLEWPQARAAEVVRLADVSLCVTDSAFDPGCRVATVDSLTGEPPAVGGSVDDPCCVFMTSGSSGRPKAAVAPHKALTRMVGDPAHAFDRQTVTLQAAPSSWDVFALELWLPLMSGGACLLFEGAHLTAQDIRMACDRGVNTLAPPAALFNGVVEDDLDCLAKIRTIVSGGERASAIHMSSALERFPDLRLVHAYGPVETAIAATAHVVEPGPRAAGSDVPIGRPVANTTVYLLDEHLNLVPDGEVGQLATAGDGLALEYVGNPAATAEKFRVVDGERVYLTGDLARVVDGELVFVGRADRQIKIRGNRVEPAEVERVIEALPGVTAAAVLPLPPDSPTVQWLAACYTAFADAPDVRAAVRAALPAAFVPDIVRRMDELPLTDNGKVDQRALAERLRDFWDRTGDTTVEADGPLRAVIEESLALLGIAPTPERDLFDIGATSMTAIRLVNRLAKRLGKQLPPADVIRLRTPRAVADALATAPPVPTATHPTAASTWPGPIKPARQQLQHWFHDRIAPGSAEALTPLLLRLHGPLNRARLQAAVRAVVARHEALRTYFPVERGRSQCDIAPPEDLSALLDVTSTMDVDKAMATAREFLSRRFHLDREIPARTLLIPLADDDHLLACSFHHVGFDGWSVQVFLSDLAVAYENSGALAPPTSFIETARRQDASVSPGEQQEAIAYWANRLRGIEPLPLPKVAKSTAGATRQLEIPLPTELTDAAETAAATVGATATAVFMAAYAGALMAELDVPATALAVPVAGRRTADADDVIGCFAESQLFGFTAVDRLVSAAADQLGTALSRPTVSQEDLFRKLRSPLTGWLGFSQARFSVQDAGLSERGLPGMRVERLLLDEDRSTVAMTMELWPCRRTGTFRYRTDVVSDELAARLVARWHAEIDRIRLELR
ncbi:AMP-binding protein [Kutzneria buriramensis]|uniref:Amino acid adenylation domain-containing protein n=1 Tax=Kutzneria buriramensis TaxID=1045776 RepID=A0A3E0HEV4_9PSEU|nr:AMP-binding protein [Kutzneria buriramensis]REH43737.1 amino acid adenylation domain-containing protein [Kutzneria buriramensis]